MKPMLRLLALVMLGGVLLCFLGGCQTDTPGGEETQPPITETVDYASSVKLNMGSFTRKLEVTVKNYVDGDTAHFYVPESEMPGGVLKARFLAINTPESTGKIEPWGKAASAFTKTCLMGAESIIIESDTADWNADSTGHRYLVWVWYKAPGMEDYRNLNIEILQNGLAIASNSNNNIYGSVCVSALEQAKQQKLKVFSPEKDPDFYDGAAVELTLRELRTNIERYQDVLVAFNCIVTSNSNDTVYVEQYDPETDLYYGISVYYGNSGLGGDGLRILGLGNEVRMVGKVQYYETGATWQISGLKYRVMKPDDPENIQLISEGHTAAYVPIDAETFVRGQREVIVRDAETEEEKAVTFAYTALTMNTTVSMQNLIVREVYTTANEESSSNGAMTLTCEADGLLLQVRTAVMYDENNQLITQDAYLGKTIDVKGIVDYYAGQYQIKVFTPNQITVH